MGHYDEETPRCDCDTPTGSESRRCRFCRAARKEYKETGKIRKPRKKALVHKSNHFSFYEQNLTLCNQLLDKPMSIMWKEVTCKECLKQEPGFDLCDRLIELIRRERAGR